MRPDPEWIDQEIERQGNTKCTQCGHTLLEHESDEEEPKLYNKWCYAEGCNCSSFRDDNWEPEDRES